MKFTRFKRPSSSVLTNSPRLDIDYSNAFNQTIIQTKKLLAYSTLET